MAKDGMVKGSTGDRKRKYPGTKLSLRPDNYSFRLQEANERAEAFGKLSIAEKIAKLDARLGEGKGAVKQRARYAKMIEAAKKQKEIDAAFEANKAVAKKEKQTKPAKNAK